MKDYIISVGAVMMLLSFSQLLLPEGGLKKFASLAAGFIIINALVAPLGKGLSEIDVGSISVSEASPGISDAQFRAEVIKKHRENLAELIEKKTRFKSRAYVETDNDGNITKITLKCKGDESECVAYIVNELKVPRERIVITYENN